MVDTPTNMAESEFPTGTGAAPGGSTEHLPSAYTRKVLIAVGISLIGLILTLLIWYFSRIILLAFAAALFAVCISGPSELLAKYARLPRALALVVVLLAVFTLFGLFFWLTGARLAGQVDEMKTYVPHAMESLRSSVQQTPVGKNVLERYDQFKLTATIDPTMGPALGIFFSTGAFVGTVAAIVIVGLFFAMSPELYMHGTAKLVPVSYRPRAVKIMQRVGLTLQWWFIGQLGSMCVITLITWTGLLILGVPLALSLGIWAGLMTFVPNFGPFIAATPAVLLALTTRMASGNSLNYWLALYVVILYVVVQLVDGLLITPTIQRHAVAIPPGLIILAQAILALAFGPFGLILAMPMLATVLVLVKSLYIEDVLGDYSGRFAHEAPET